MYRSLEGRPLYREMRHALGPPRQGDPVRAALDALPAPVAGVAVYVPRGLGHADHQLLREWIDRRGLGGGQRIDYEDYPYEAGSIEGAEEQALSPEESARKFAAIRRYGSQLHVLWQSDEEMQREMSSRVERYWLSQAPRSA